MVTTNIADCRAYFKSISNTPCFNVWQLNCYSARNTTLPMLKMLYRYIDMLAFCMLHVKLKLIIRKIQQNLA